MNDVSPDLDDRSVEPAHGGHGSVSIQQVGTLVESDPAESEATVSIHAGGQDIMLDLTVTDGPVDLGAMAALTPDEAEQVAALLQAAAER